ncbi:BRO family protein [Pseudomonas sp. 21LCFQ010]|uniref:BRO-N domain-containing protein n=1 Tax=Pseudomonas sp. 21LCFQ010 TaxID=2957506 RepID=UPI002097C823|nr:BRO family protein [Pseudomonas sp. 21LCFQ010]MCO8160970.1 BRO family protein [Pseudomonas sp. 21LCFQ010]
MQAAHVIPFQFESQEVRTCIIREQPWFAAQDILRSLGYTESYKPARATAHVPEQWKDVHRLHTPGGPQKLLMLSEQGMYFFLGRSDKPKALPIQMWVAGEVLPAIRKHGRYEDTDNRMATLLGQTIGTDGFHMLGALIKGKVSSLPVPVQRRAKAKIWSQTHAAFGVRSAADIPADQLDAARNFIAAYALEGEWLPKPDRLEIEAGPTRRYLVSFNDAGERQIKPVPLDAFVMTHQQFIKGLLTPGDMMVSTEELIEVAMAALGHLKARSGFQSDALPGL